MWKIHHECRSFSEVKSWDFHGCTSLWSRINPRVFTPRAVRNPHETLDFHRKFPWISSDKFHCSFHARCKKKKNINQWIGLRENLQETMVFTIKYRAFPVNFPIIQFYESIQNFNAPLQRPCCPWSLMDWCDSFEHVPWPWSIGPSWLQLMMGRMMGHVPIESLKLTVEPSNHTRSMYGIYANIWGILMVNVTIYSIHGSYGICNHNPL